MQKIGVAICHPTVPYNEEYFRALSEAGVDLIEITRYAEEYDLLDYKSMEKWSETYGVGLWSYHLPFYAGNSGRAVNITTADKEVREKTFGYYTEIMGRAADIGIDKFILHPGNDFLRDEDREEHLLRSMEFLCRMADTAAEYGAVIAVEDMIPGIIGHSAEEMERLLGANDKLRMCFDTNHLFKDSHADYIRRFGERIITIHASDYDFKAEKHWLPGEGDIDWAELTGLLDEVGYDGPLMYEVNPVIPDTIIRESVLEYSDYVRNAKYIFDGHTPPPLGKRI